MNVRGVSGGSLRELVVGVARGFWQDRVLGLAAEAAFWQLLSLPPLLLGMLGTLGFLSGFVSDMDVANVEAGVLHTARRVIAPQAVNSLVAPAVHAVLHSGRLDVVSIGFLLSLWSGSTAMATYVNTITIAYDLRECRSAVRSRLLALALYVGFVAVGVVVLPALVLGPRILTRLVPAGVRPEVAATIAAAYWPVVVLGSVGALATLYHLAVPVRTRWVRALPGTVLALVVWLLGSAGLREYVAFVVHASSVYSSMSAPIAVLLFFYVTALAVLVGAELNGEVDKIWPSAATARARERGRIARLAAVAARRLVPVLRPAGPGGSRDGPFG